ncbi:MAG: insulinase family protein [Pyrinomonadaceae bacterium]|nr:insulinase family protein [Acidobacteriota bacterium]MBK7933422.1 insulinase family protein [Acidobacteriota bacterium]MBP7376959.1 insulinase family protein [Pyrinomonadaceae bacterium]
MKEEIQQTRLDNGLTILTDRMPGVRSATLGFFFRVGSRQEPLELNGISHFIEHTVFKGTAKRTALDIAIEQDRLGGNLDAFTSHEETGFAIKVIDDQLPRAFDLIADMLVNPRFDEADLKAEQKVIIEEMKMVEDSPEDHLGDLFNEAVFGSHPLGLSIAGTPETVRSFDREKTRKYFVETYNASNLVIAAAGNVDHEALVELVQSAGFSLSSLGAEDKLKLALSTPSLAAPIVIKQNPNLEQAHLIIATPLVSATDERRYAADLLSNIIGGGTSSRLWQKIREERGLAYSVGASAVMYQDVGMFSVFAGTSPDQVEEVVELAVAEMRDFAKNGVINDELDLAKAQTTASILLGLEDSAGRAATLAQSEMVHGRQISLDEALDAINAVTTGDIHALASEHFRTENVMFAALGDLAGLTIGREHLAI